MKRIVGLGYQARTGKDSVADYLCTNYGYHKVSFAGSLKEVCRVMFGFTDEQLYGVEKEVVDPFWGFSPREAFQRLGTDTIRVHFDPSVWVRSLHRHILNRGFRMVVISDVRFRLEAEYIQQLGGRLIRCACPDLPKQLSDTTAAHVSEQELADFQWPHTLTARFGDLPSLYRQVDLLRSKGLL